ncbi:YpsA SLOG family protein [Zavarzinella formosa]|uniref:YpsA SLOG family protein n=1 Tax=Zavarzinella formosa TaxID=360055 RepID=UPI0007C45BF5|nr:putative molybdenum carrier protein [Zavarzinella formosa]
MLKLVISGGQTGADRGGLIAAKACGLPTGGWMPKGFLAHDGRRPDLAAEFGLQEHTSVKYPPRTRMNVQHADATIRIARNWASWGELLTMRFIQQYAKPWCDVDAAKPVTTPEDIAEFLVRHRVAVLNIAGNSESAAPGIEQFAVEFLVRVFQLSRG